MNNNILEALTIIEEEENRTKKDIEIIRKAKKEIERLNNIITELEKWLEEKQKLVCGCGITPEYIDAYENVLEYLKELKESDKE